MGMAVFAAVMAAVSASAASVPVTSMSLDSDFVVGYVDGKLDNANPRSEMAAAQRLLDLAKGLTSTDTKTTTQRRGEVKIETLATYYANTAIEYSGLFAEPVAGSSRAVAPVGCEYVIAKYAEKGYVLYKLDGLEPTTLPEFSSFFSETKYGISGYTAIAKTPIMASPVPEPSTYVAGALMLVPLGVGLLRKARKNRAA